VAILGPVWPSALLPCHFNLPNPCIIADALVYKISGITTVQICLDIRTQSVQEAFQRGAWERGMFFYCHPVCDWRSIRRGRSENACGPRMATQYHPYSINSHMDNFDISGRSIPSPTYRDKRHPTTSPARQSRDVGMVPAWPSALLPCHFNSPNPCFIADALIYGIFGITTIQICLDIRTQSVQEAFQRGAWERGSINPFLGRLDILRKLIYSIANTS